MYSFEQGVRIQGTDRMPGGRVIFLIAFKLVSGTRFGVGMQIFTFPLVLGTNFLRLGTNFSKFRHLFSFIPSVMFNMN